MAYLALRAGPIIAEVGKRRKWSVVAGRGQVECGRRILRVIHGRDARAPSMSREAVVRVKPKAKLCEPWERCTMNEPRSGGRDTPGKNLLPSLGFDSQPTSFRRIDLLAQASVRRFAAQ